MHLPGCGPEIGFTNPQQRFKDRISNDIGLWEGWLTYTTSSRPTINFREMNFTAKPRPRCWNLENVRWVRICLYHSYGLWLRAHSDRSRAPCCFDLRRKPVDIPDVKQVICSSSSVMKRLLLIVGCESLDSRCWHALCKQGSRGGCLFITWAWINHRARLNERINRPPLLDELSTKQSFISPDD